MTLSSEASCPFGTSTHSEVELRSEEWEQMGELGVRAADRAWPAEKIDSHVHVESAAPMGYVRHQPAQ